MASTQPTSLESLVKNFGPMRFAAPVSKPGFEDLIIKFLDLMMACGEIRDGFLGDFLGGENVLPDSKMPLEKSGRNR